MLENRPGWSDSERQTRLTGPRTTRTQRSTTTSRPKLPQRIHTLKLVIRQEKRAAPNASKEASFYAGYNYEHYNHALARYFLNSSPPDFLVHALRSLSALRGEIALLEKKKERIAVEIINMEEQASTMQEFIARFGYPEACAEPERALEELDESERIRK